MRLKASGEQTLKVLSSFLEALGRSWGLRSEQCLGSIYAGIRMCIKVRPDRSQSRVVKLTEVSQDLGRVLRRCGPLMWAFFFLFTVWSQASLECSLLPFVHHISCPSTGDTLPGEQVRVLGLLHEELHGPGPLGALSSLAQTEVTLSGTMGQASAHILYRRPRQRPTLQVRRSRGLEVGVRQRGRAVKQMMCWSTSLGPHRSISPILSSLWEALWGRLFYYPYFVAWKAHIL